MAYSSAVFNNCGNFKSFGDTKFVPELEFTAFEKIIKSSEAYRTHLEVIDNIMSRISHELYSEEDPHRQIGFPDKNGCTSYYSANCTSDDAKFIDEFCQRESISPLNTRLFKSADGKTFDLRIASELVDTVRMPYLKSYPLENGITVNVTAGDFSKFMAKVTDAAEKAKWYTDSPN
jgi:dipeptidyl-peptidase-3